VGHDQHTPDAREIEAAAQRLREGRLVAFPTETVYGLGADALSESAVARVFAAKGRPSHNPLIVHVATIEMARRVVKEWTKEAEALAKAFWPGPVTIVLEKAACVPGNVTGGGPNVAVRWPRHPVAAALITSFGGPIVGPSANPSGFVSPTTALHVHQAFAGMDVQVLDGGPCEVGIESAVVSLVDGPRVLRLGAVSAEQISKVLGVKVTAGKKKTLASGLASGTQPGTRSGTHALESPGQMESHYAPRSPTILVDASKLKRALDEAQGRCVVLGPLLTSVPKQHRVIPMPMDAAAYASRLYAALREADDLEPALIAVVKPTIVKGSPDEPMWNAIMDRLKRATA
jgi:L-threonylcarbamoyladenylate synthase